MKMAPLDIVDGSYADEDKSFSAQDTVNYLPTSAEQNGTRTPTMLRTCPGLKPAVAIGATPNEEVGFQLAGPIRNTYNAEGRFFAVAGNTLYQITTAGISIPLGTVPGVGRVSFSHNQITNGNEILVNNGNSGYIYNTLTQVFQRITDTSYPGGLQAVFINNRFVQIEPARRYLFNSDLADGLSYNALDRFTSETSPDLVMSIQSIGNQLAVFSSTTTEWFEDTGANPQPFRSTGIVADKGASGPFSTAKMDNQLFMLADDGVFYRYQGYNPVRISTKPIEQAIRGKNWFNVFTTVWEDSGYAVCYWTFPDGETWGYDASTNKWHRRESYGLNRWRLSSLTYWQNKWHGGDFQRGHLWEVDWDYQLEGDQEFECIRAAGVISDNQNRMIHQRLELLVNTGMVETTPVAFGEQPLGPTISGSAPDGAIGMPYSYTYTTTPGDAAIVRTILFGDDIADFGLSWNQATATLSGTPTINGVINVTPRVVDANGLYDELDDEINIGLAMLAIRGRNVAGQNFGDYLRGGAGGDFSTSTWTQYTNAVELDPTYLDASGERFIAWSTTGPFRYTDNYGTTWGTSSGDDAGGSGGLRKAVVFGQTIIVAGGINEMRRSVDGGLSYSIITGSPDSNIIVGDEDNLVSADISDNDTDLSTDQGDNWIDTTALGMTALADGFLFDGQQHFTGSTTGPVCAVRRTLNGGAFTSYTMPSFSTATQVTAGTATVIDGEEAFAIGTNSGEFAYFDPADSTVKLSAQSMDVQCRGMTFNGGVVAAIGSGGGRGQIWTSADGGRTWTKQRDETGQTGEWTAIASMRAT